MQVLCFLGIKAQISKDAGAALGKATQEILNLLSQTETSRALTQRLVDALPLAYAQLFSMNQLAMLPKAATMTRCYQPVSQAHKLGQPIAPSEQSLWY